MKYARAITLFLSPILFTLILLFCFKSATPALVAAELRTDSGVPSATLGATIPTTSTMAPAKDTTIYENTEASGGASPTLLAGNTAREGVRRALLQFDLASIPVDATIISATLKLQVTKVGNSTPVTFTLHKVSADWGEAGSSSSDGKGASAQAGDATWKYSFYTTTTWTTEGADFVAEASAATQLGSTGSYLWSSQQLVSDLQSWLSTPTDNFGWILIGDESASRSTKFVGSRENLDSALRPELTLVYSATNQSTENIYLPLIQR